MSFVDDKAKTPNKDTRGFYSLVNEIKQLESSCSGFVSLAYLDMCSSVKCRSFLPKGRHVFLLNIQLLPPVFFASIFVTRMTVGSVPGYAPLNIDYLAFFMQASSHKIQP